MRRPRFIASLLLWGLLAAHGGTLAGHGRIVQVSNTGIEVGPACSLVDAIQSANSDTAVNGCTKGSGADTILIPEGTTMMTAPYANPAWDPWTGLPHITSPITIIGAGQDETIIERALGSPSFRFFHVRPPGVLTLRDLTLRGGNSGTSDGGALATSSFTTIERVTFEDNIAGAAGGGVAASIDGLLTVRDSVFTNNRATWGGGAYLRNAGTISGSRFTGNRASNEGGAIHMTTGQILDTTMIDNVADVTGGALGGGSAGVTATRVIVQGNRAATGGGIKMAQLSVIDSLISGNQATNGDGGGIAIPPSGDAYLELIGSTVAGNVASRHGGGVDANRWLTLRNGTITGNWALRGGGVDHSGVATIENATVTANHANEYAGGLQWISSTTPLTLANSIIAGNTSGLGYVDCYNQSNPFTSRGHNLIGDGSGCPISIAPGDQIGTTAAPLDPKLEALADNGGPTPTMQPRGDSPAFEQGSDEAPGSSPTACVAVDQRGAPRPERTRCDIGAVERPNTTPIVDPLEITTREDAAIDFTVTAADAEGDPVTLTIVAQPLHGEVSGTAPNYTYTPSRDFNGPDTLEMVAADPFGEGSPTTIVITVTAANDPPTAVDDTATAVGNGLAQTIDVLANDSIVPDDGESLVVSAVTNGAHGAVAIAAAADHVTYAPALNYSGDDSFTYTIADGNGGSATATVQVTVEPPPLVTIEVIEQVSVSDQSSLLPSAMLHVDEAIGVLDDPLLVPAAMIDVLEQIAVVDGADVDPLEIVVIEILESVAVSDGQEVMPAAVIVLAESILVGDGLDVDSLEIAVIEVLENVAVNDGPMLTPAAVIAVAEAILVVDGSDVDPLEVAVIEILESVAVSDGPVLIPAAVIALAESILVGDGLDVDPREIAIIEILESVAVSDGPNLTPTVVIGVTETIAVADGSEIRVESAGNTPAGSNVSVEPTDPVTGETPVAVTFTTVVQGGDTTVTTAASGPPPPPGFEAGAPTLVFDVSTSAQFSGTASVCIDDGATAYSDREARKVVHFEGGAWIDRTWSVTATRACATVTSFSPFAILVPLTVAGRMTGEGSLASTSGREHDFHFRVVERASGDERGRVVYTATTSKSGKQRKRVDRFESTAIGPVAFSDDPAFKPGARKKPTIDAVTFSGTGTWNGATGYTFEARATDQGEPGRGRDTFAITIRNTAGAIVATASGMLTNGNIQSRRLPGRN